MTKVVELGFNTQGVLLMSDDVLLKFWNLSQFDLKKIWFPEKIITGENVNKLNSWPHWNDGGRARNHSVILLKFLNQVADGKEIDRLPEISNYPGKLIRILLVSYFNIFTDFFNIMTRLELVN